MSIIKVNNLRFAYPGSADNVFKNVNFQLDTEWKLGFIGRNGRGKSTFLHLLCEKYTYSGSISASVAFEYFPYEVKSEAENTLQLLRQICPDRLEWEIAREISLLGVCEDVLERSFATLSNGEQTKVRLAALFLKENSFLLIDEPTNHLDAAARATLSAYLSRKRGFIVVSHDRAFLDGCIDHVLSINRADIEVQAGNFSSWWRNKEMRDSFELATQQKLEKDVTRLTAAAKRTANWSDAVEKTKFDTRNSGLRPDRGYLGHKAAKMMKTSKTIAARRKDAIAEKSQLLKNVETQESLRVTPLVFRAQRLIEFRDAALFYGEKQVCSALNFTVEQGERIAICGKNGCGKSSIFKLICGEKIDFTGAFTKASGLKISYVPQSAAFLSGSLRAYTLACEADESLFKALLRKMGFEREQFEKPMETFSEGQKKKVLLARSLCEQAHLYLWDEPLNYIDVYSRVQIEELLQASRATLLFVEHDAAFCEHIATRQIKL